MLLQTAGFGTSQLPEWVTFTPPLSTLSADNNVLCSDYIQSRTWKQACPQGSRGSHMYTHKCSCTHLCTGTYNTYNPNKHTSFWHLKFVQNIKAEKNCKIKCESFFFLNKKNYLKQHPLQIEELLFTVQNKSQQITESNTKLGCHTPLLLVKIRCFKHRSIITPVC